MSCWNIIINKNNKYLSFRTQLLSFPKVSLGGRSSVLRSGHSWPETGGGGAGPQGPQGRGHHWARRCWNKWAFCCLEYVLTKYWNKFFCFLQSKSIKILLFYSGTRYQKQNFTHIDKTQKYFSNIPLWFF